MRAGELRQRVEILEDKGDEQNEYAGTGPNWQVVARRWVKVEPITGREDYLNHQIRAEATIQIRMRFSQDITPKHRIRYRGRVLEINSIVNVEERNRELVVVCKEPV